MQRRYWEACAAAAVLIACGALAMHELKSSTVVSASGAKKPAFVSWTAYGGSNGGDQYSELTQINRTNANKLEQVWFYPSGNNGFRYGSTRCHRDGVMFLYGKNNNVVAVDATTGKEVWVYDTGNPRQISHRGMAYWESKDRSDQRIFFSMNNELHVVDTKTGKAIPTFGNNGAVDLREGLGQGLRVQTVRQIGSGIPGRVFENLHHPRLGDGEEGQQSPPGDLRAYDVIHGKAGVGNSIRCHIRASGL